MTIRLLSEEPRGTVSSNEILIWGSQHHIWVLRSKAFQSSHDMHFSITWAKEILCSTYRSQIARVGNWWLDGASPSSYKAQRLYRRLSQNKSGLDDDLQSSEFVGSIITKDVFTEVFIKRNSCGNCLVKALWRCLWHCLHTNTEVRYYIRGATSRDIMRHRLLTLSGSQILKDHFFSAYFLPPVNSSAIVTCQTE
jgi:hypothetical protein